MKQKKLNFDKQYLQEDADERRAVEKHVCDRIRETGSIGSENTSDWGVWGPDVVSGDFI